jgi:hypothetical protein
MPKVCRSCSRLAKGLFLGVATAPLPLIRGGGCRFFSAQASGAISSPAVREPDGKELN